VELAQQQARMFIVFGLATKCPDNSSIKDKKALMRTTKALTYFSWWQKYE